MRKEQDGSYNEELSKPNHQESAKDEKERPIPVKKRRHVHRRQGEREDARRDLTRTSALSPRKVAPASAAQVKVVHEPTTTAT